MWEYPKRENIFSFLVAPPFTISITGEYSQQGCALLCYGDKSMRTDRFTGNRAAYENARQKILKTQTICGICGKPVDFSLKYPHPLSATVDHIIPVSKGGHPSDLSNLQLAHRCCNREKSDKLMASQETTTTPKVISNRVLPLHCDWLNYKCN